MPSYDQWSQSVTIASGQQDSAAVNLVGGTLCGVYLPAAFTGASLTFKASTAVGGTYKEVLNEDGTPYTVTVSADGYSPVDPSVFAGVLFLKVRSASAEGAGRSLDLSIRRL